MSSFKILIVDDDPLTCQLIATMLKLHGYQSAVLTDPDRILGVIAAENPQLVLMDYHLGTSHGLDVLQRVRDNAASETIPIIMTSGMDYSAEALEAGAEGFLVKPFDWHQLAALIVEIRD